MASLGQQVAKTSLAVSAAKAVMTRSTYGPAYPKDERDLLCPSRSAGPLKIRYGKPRGGRERRPRRPPEWASSHGGYYGGGGAAVTADLLHKISFAISSSPALIAAVPASIA